MGVANLDWYRKRGLIKKRTVTFTEDSITVKLGKGKPGETIEVEEPTERYSCGRIDIRAVDYFYDSELGVPPMRDEDWYRFGDWLRTFETDDVWTLAQLVEMYERINPRIQWWQDEQPNFAVEKHHGLSQQEWDELCGQEIEKELQKDATRKRCNWLLTAMLGKDNVELWWQSRNKAFDMKTAEQQFDTDPESVYNYLVGFVQK
jgi:hypothetical protein